MKIYRLYYLEQEYIPSDYIDEDGNIQFILCDIDGKFYKTNKCKGFYKLYDVTTMQ